MQLEAHIQVFYSALKCAICYNPLALENQEVRANNNEDFEDLDAAIK